VKLGLLTAPFARRSLEHDDRAFEGSEERFRIAREPLRPLVH
jgi:hypothetical protein